MASTSARIRLTRIMQQKSKRTKPKGAIREAEKKSKWDIVRGDKVQVVSKGHPEHGKQGQVLAVLRKQDRIIVDGVNLGPKFVKGDPDRGIKGRMITKERSMHYSNVNLVDPVTNKPTRIYKKILEDGSKVRVAKKSGAVIPRPDILLERKRPLSTITTESCTTSDADVWEITYGKYNMDTNMEDVKES